MARIFAIVWVLVGLVITSIFTGVVTTSLTAITLSTDVKLYGTTVGFSLTRNVIISRAQLFNSWLRISLVAEPLTSEWKSSLCFPSDIEFI